MSPDIQAYLTEALTRANERVHDTAAEVAHAQEMLGGVVIRADRAVKWRDELQEFILQHQEAFVAKEVA
jgi:hypothetical protein